jgi:chemotaxis receptor (MCP) glutamine deamidase CheD
VRASRSTRFGTNAMELLINGIMGLGGRRARLRAKVFGGARILPGIPSAQSTGLRNLAFVERFLALESIPVLAQDVGGTATRILKFHTDTGTALVRRVHPTELRVVLDAEADLRRRVRRAMQRDTDVTLFT